MFLYQLRFYKLLSSLNYESWDVHFSYIFTINVSSFQNIGENIVYVKGNAWPVKNTSRFNFRLDSSITNVKCVHSHGHFEIFVVIVRTLRKDWPWHLCSHVFIAMTKQLLDNIQERGEKPFIAKISQNKKGVGREFWQGIAVRKVVNWTTKLSS